MVSQRIPSHPRGSKGSPRDSQGNPKGPPRDPQGPRRTPKDPQETPKGSPREPQGNSKGLPKDFQEPQGTPKGKLKDNQRRPKIPTGLQDSTQTSPRDCERGWRQRRSLQIRGPLSGSRVRRSSFKFCQDLSGSRVSASAAGPYLRGAPLSNLGAAHANMDHPTTSLLQS